MRELLCGFRHPAVDRPTHLMHMSCNSPCSFSDMPFYGTRVSCFTAALEYQRNVEMALESRAVCEKWGIPAGTIKYDGCVADIDAVREHHEKRVMEDFGFLGTL